jgi:hypothetical protein
MAKARRYAAEPDWRAKESRKSYQRHREAVIARTTARNRQTKVDVITTLGGKCACCGEMEPKFLTLDHVNGDGAAHRKALTGKSRASSIRIYREVKRQGCPPDRFRVLCWNCNCAIGLWGSCPHGKLPDHRSPSD